MYADKNPGSRWMGILRRLACCMAMFLMAELGNLVPMQSVASNDTLVHALPEENDIEAVPAGRALLYYQNTNGRAIPLVFAVNGVSLATVLFTEYAVVDVEPGTVELEHHLSTDGLSYGAIGKAIYTVYPGQKIYIQDRGVAIEVAPLEDLLELEIAEHPSAQITLCDGNVQVCSDSPWKPQPTL